MKISVTQSKEKSKGMDYVRIIDKHPWIIERNHECILSPDTDGVLCGLFMSHYLNWRIGGFYDGKILIINENIAPKDCIFLDVEILRKDVRSVGHHMNVHNFYVPPKNYHELMSKCVNPNYIRGFDRYHNFYQKYPLGTIHLLLFILSVAGKNPQIKKEGLGVIFFADGIWKILFKYTNNFLDWFDFLDIEGKSDWWLRMQNLTIIELIKEIVDILKKLQDIHPENKKWYGHIDISKFDHEKQKLLKCLDLFGEISGWVYNPGNWLLENLKINKFVKKIDSNNSNNQLFAKVWRKGPLSLAMTAKSQIEYTIDEQKLF